MDVLVPRARDLARAAARAGIGLQHRRRGGRAARPLARRDRGADGRPAARRLGRLRRGRAGLRPAGGGGDRLARTRSPCGTTGGSWCGSSRAPTGTARSSRRRRRGCRASRSSPASPRPTSATSPTPGSSSTRATGSIRSSRRTTPTPSRRCWRWPARPQRLRVPAPARHGRGAARDRARARGHALPHLCAGRGASRPARLPRAPAARERGELVVRQPDRRQGPARRGDRGRSARGGRGPRRGRRQSGDPGARGAVRAARRTRSGGTSTSRPRSTALVAARAPWREHHWLAAPRTGGGEPRPVVNPADPGDIVGTVAEATAAEVAAALAAAPAGFAAWSAVAPARAGAGAARAPPTSTRRTRPS